MDVVVCNNVGPAEIYENLGGNEVNFWIKVKVMHRCKQEPRLLCDSLGARVQVKQEDTGLNQTQEIGSSTHFLAQSETTAHFGLGSSANNVTVHVTWPTTGSQLYIYNVPVNTRLQIVQPESNTKRTEYLSLEICPTLKVTEIIKQPKQGKIEINSDDQTARYYIKNPTKQLSPNSKETFEDMELQEFSYRVQIFPNDSNSASVVNSAMIYFVEEQDCHNGKPVEYKELKPTDERRYDGISNNKQHLMWGAVRENLRRRSSPAYSDGIATPASVCVAKQRNNNTCAYKQEYSGYGSTRPSPREISNVLFRQTKSIISERKINDFHVHFGQFLSHDTDLTITLPRFEFQETFNDVWLPISVPKGDVYFDLGDSDSSYLPFLRSVYNRCTGREAGVPREQINLISSYIDGNMVYGSNVKRNKLLRTLSQGKMKVWEHEMLPLNEFGVANGNDVGRATKRLFLAGDTRANIQPGLTAIHTVFVREHNRICDEYLKDKPNASDEEVFQYARKIVIAELQAITFREYLPSLLGGSEDIPQYRSYNDRVDATTDHILTTAAFRFGHSQINTIFWRLDEHNKTISEGHLPMRDAYFAPERIIEEGGIDPIIRGSFAQPAQQVDTK
ncbi:Peroxinectin A, partial [Paramuricea clavata]